MRVDNEQLVLIESVAEVTGAELLRGALEAEGIHSVLQERNPNGVVIQLNSVLLNTMYDLYVSATDVEAARAVVDTYNTGRGEFSEEELAAAAEAAYDERV